MGNTRHHLADKTCPYSLSLKGPKQHIGTKQEKNELCVIHKKCFSQEVVSTYNKKYVLHLNVATQYSE